VLRAGGRPLVRAVVWTKVDISDDVQLREAVLLCRSLAEKSNEVHLRHDLEWIVANEGRWAVSLFVDRDVPAFAAMFRHWRSLKFSLGEMPIFVNRLPVDVFITHSRDKIRAMCYEYPTTAGSELMRDGAAPRLSGARDTQQADRWVLRARASPGFGGWNSRHCGRYSASLRDAPLATSKESWLVLY
jgi:hypothetical protein